MYHQAEIEASPEASFIARGHVYYHSNLSSAVSVCRLACTHSPIVQRDTL